MTNRSWRRRFGILAATTLALSKPTGALFGFGDKRFKYEGLITSGSLGLDNLDGQIEALGDYNGDQYLDVLVLSSDRSRVDIHQWDHSSFSFSASPAASLDVPTGLSITNVVAADFDYDGRLDILVMAQKGSSPADELQMMIWRGTERDGLSPETIHVPSSTVAQPVVLDATGNMRADLLAHEYSGARGAIGDLKLWRNVLEPGNGSVAFEIEKAPLSTDAQSPAGGSCHLASPHSSAFIDLDGDCLADLFLVCTTPSSSQLTYQIWTNSKSSPSGFVLSRTGLLPEGAGALSFADMDRDGTIDVVFPSCDGAYGECYINIAFNRQAPLCAEKSSGPFGTGPSAPPGKDKGTLQCRDPEDLCHADPKFLFNFTPSENNDAFTRIPVSSILPERRILLSDTLTTPATPLALHLGDHNKDGYPDIVLITVPDKAKNDETRVHLLQNVGCQNGGAGCPRDAAKREGRRTMERVTNGAEALAYVTDARSASFIDVDEDGTLDLMLQRLPLSGDRTNKRRVTFIQNNYFHDAFFLKALVLNGACLGYCDGAKGEPKYRPWGVNYGGASFKFTVLDTNGVRRAQSVGQLPQTSYRSLLTPYSYFGLGRTNNYVESLFVGSTRRQREHYLAMEGVIPNSQVVIIPWQGGDKQGAENGKRGDPATWQKELYLHPGEWIPWVTVVLVTAIVMLAGLVFVLHLNERREDERERKRAVHAINFDAL